MKEQEERIDINLDKKVSRRALMRGAVILAGGTAVSVLEPCVSLADAQVGAATVPATTAGEVTASVKKNITETEYGKVYGSSLNGVISFKGIPYGAPIGGKNRFMPPMKPASWPGVRSALHWGPVCPQYYTNTVEGRRGGRINAITQAELKAKQGAAPAFLYWFQWQSPVCDGRARAFHCIELPFVFHSTDLCDFATGGGSGARNLADRVSDAWINFARKGDPNHPGLPTWPKYDANVPTMIFDTKCIMANDSDGPGRKAVAAKVIQRHA